MASVFNGVNDRFFTYSFTAGGTGFRVPSDIAIAPGDIIYALNRGYEHPVGRNINARIKVIGMGDEGEELITHIGSYGSEPGQLRWPMSIALDNDVNVYVCDEFLNRITIWNRDGDYLSHWGNYGSGDGELDGPSGLAIRGNVMFVVDSRNNRIQKFSLDGKYIGQFGSFGDAPGQLNRPWGIGLDKEGNVFVADWRNDRIQSFTADGEWLACFGEPAGTGDAAATLRLHGGLRLVPRPEGVFNRPAGVCVDDDGDIYVADWGNNRAQALTSDGKFITQFTGSAGLSRFGLEQISVAPDLVRQRNLAMQDSSQQERLLWGPRAVKFDDNRRRLIIVDSNRHRLQVYQKNTDYNVITNSETLTTQGAYRGSLS